MAPSREFAPPWFAWIIVLAAFALGVYMHSRSPMGVFLHTPIDWCSERIHAFGLGYLAVLAGAVIASVMVWLGCLAAKAKTASSGWRLSLGSLSRTALRCLATFLMAMALTPVLQLLMPLQIDQACQLRLKVPR